jgi:GT2 family glycosyltransferase
MNYPKVCVVTVTYGNRFHLLKQVVDAALKEGVCKIIVVDNNSEPKSREKLKEYEKKLGSQKIKVLYLDDNYGSAGGFKRGLEEAYNAPECEFILLLDDDNVLEKDSISKSWYLISYLKDLNYNYMLSFCRKDREDCIKFISEDCIKVYLPNNFCGFSLRRYIKDKIITKITKSSKKRLYFKELHSLYPIDVAPYGGLLFHKSILSKIGYPREDFYLYADDHEFTYRFTKSGGVIFLCGEIKLKDIDVTTIFKGKIISYYDKEFPEYKFYYQIRNHTFFSKYFITSNLIFYTNLFIFLLINFKQLFKVSDKKIFFKRYIVLLKAIKDGLNGILGKRQNYE